MTWVQIPGAHTSKAGAGAGGSTTDPIDTTGADFIVRVISYLSVASGGTALAAADSKAGNVWNVLTSRSNGSETCVIYWCRPTSVGTGHTFSATGTAVYASQQVIAFSGSLASPFDQQNGAAGNAATLQPGSISLTSPAQDNELIIFGFGFNQSTASVSMDSGFTQADAFVNFSGGVALGVAAGYLIQTTAGAVNPTGTRIGSSDIAAVIASFKAAPPSSGELIDGSLVDGALIDGVLVQ